MGLLVGLRVGRLVGRLVGGFVGRRVGNGVGLGVGIDSISHKISIDCVLKHFSAEDREWMNCKSL